MAQATKAKGWVHGGYRRFYLPKHPTAAKDGEVREHRMVWYDAYGEIPAGHDIHHKNGDRLDNRLENLECISHGDHTRHHGWLLKWRATHTPWNAGTKTWEEFVCGVCGKDFKRPIGTRKNSLKHGWSTTCSKRCRQALSVEARHGAEAMDRFMAKGAPDA